MNSFISNRAIKRLPLLFISALAGLLGAALLIVGARPTQAQEAANIDSMSIDVSSPILTADGVSTALITVTVLSNTVPISNVTLSGFLSPTTLGNITPFSPTDSSGRAFSTWTAGTVAGSGELIVGDGGFTRTTNITLTAGPLVTITVSPNPATVTVGMTRTFAAAGVDRYSNPVPIAPTWTTNGGTINANGVFTAQTVVAAGRLVTATQNSISGTATVNIIVGTPTTITLQVTPATLIVNSNQTSSITATVVDLYGNRVPNVSLSRDLSPSTLGTVSLSSTTNTNGQAFGTWTAGSFLGSGSLKVTNGSVTGTAAITLTVGQPYTITMQATPPSLVAGSTSSLLAIVTDQFGNPVANGTPVTFTSSIGNVSPPIGTTLSGAAASSINSTQAGVAFITATSASAQGTITVTFAPDVPAALALQASPASLVVGHSSVLTATVRDRYNNVVANGILVTFTSDLGNVVSPTLATTNGTATSSITSTLAGTAHITATTGGIVSDTVSVTFVPSTTFFLTLQVAPAVQVVGNNSTLTATVTDQFGNSVANGTLVTITRDLGNVISPVATTNGIATSAISSTRVGTAHITATSGLGQDTGSVTFVPGAAFSLTLQAQPVSQTVGFSSTLTATVYDRFHNLVANNTSVTFAKDLPGTILSPVTTMSGIATSQVTITLASVAHITATSGAASNATVVTFTPGTPTMITVQVNPPNLIASSGMTATITATVVDRFNNPVPRVPLTGSVPSALGTVSGLGATGDNGQARGTWTAGSTVGNGLLSVTNGAITGTSSVALLLSHPQTVTVQVISPTLVANGSMTTTVIATVRDAFGNLIPNAALNFGLVPLTLGSIVSPSVTTDGSGRAYNTWVAGTVVTRGLVIASATITATGSAAITLTADLPYTVTLQANPTSPVVGIGSTLMATVTDRFHNLVADGTSVTFTSDAGTVVSPRTTTNGVAFSQINWTRVGTVHITATSGLAKGTTTVNFVPDVPYTLTLQVNPPSLVVGKSSVLTALVQDRFSNPVENGTLVTVTTDLGSVASPVTTTNGVAHSSISSTRSGAAHVVAKSKSAQDAETVTFLAGLAANTAVQLGTDTLVVNTGTSTGITVTVIDLYGNRVPGWPLSSYLTPTTLGSLTWQSPTTNLNGQAFGRWWAGTVPGNGALVVNGAFTPVRLAPRLGFLSIVMRGFPPTPTGKWVRINGGADNAYQITATLQVSATVPADHIEWMRFSNDGTEWGDWVTFAPTATWILDPSNGLKTVYAQFVGHAGGVSAVISDNILLFKNGDFSQPNLASWNLDPGSVLNVSTAAEPGNPSNPAGLIGNPAYACNNVPVGSGSLAQDLIMPNVAADQQLALRFNYHIYTSDRNVGLQLNLDRFDVFLDNTRVFSDMNQDRNKGPQPYPPPTPPVCTVYDLGSREATILVTGNPGSHINVVLRLYNLPDQYYNTYVYVDNIRLELQGRSTRLSNEVPSLPDASGGRMGR